MNLLSMQCMNSCIVYLIKRGKKLLPLYEAKQKKIAALCYDKIVHVM